MSVIINPDPIDREMVRQAQLDAARHWSGVLDRESGQVINVLLRLPPRAGNYTGLAGNLAAERLGQIALELGRQSTEIGRASIDAALAGSPS